MASLVGSRVERKEDTRFLQGKGDIQQILILQIKHMLFLLDLRTQEQRLKA